MQPSQQAEAVDLGDSIDRHKVPRKSQQLIMVSNDEVIGYAQEAYRIVENRELRPEHGVSWKRRVSV